MTTASAADRVIEVKRTLDGREQRFECELIHRDARVLVVLYRFERRGRQLRSYGLFWPRRPYNCYYVVPAEGDQVAFARFDVVAGLEVRPDLDPPEVCYRDLLLDLWVDADGARFEDEDEVEAAWASLDAADRARIERGRTVLERGHPRIRAEVRRLLIGLGQLPGAPADDRGGSDLEEARA
ncbi:MAG: DUF402 domain-containing protein [Dehalococcoidia bacterium]